MIAKVLQNMGINGTVTGGYNQQIIEHIEDMGINTKQVGAEDIVVDEVNKIISTPAYVEGKSIGEVATGITKLVDKVLELV